MIAKSQFIIICERAFTAAGSNNLNLVNIFTQIHAAAFPFTHPQFAVVVNFDTDTPGSRTLHIDITDPAGAQVARTELPVTTSIGNWQVITNFELMRFAVPGAYTFHLTLDGQPLGERVLQVLPAAVSNPQKTNLA